MATDDLAALLHAASSPDWAIRAEAGRRLAARAEHADAAAALHRLLLDAHDTAVTDAVADEEELDHLSWPSRTAEPRHQVDLGVSAEFRGGMPD